MAGFTPKPGGKGDEGEDDGAESSFRSGAGWVVVAFISPVGMDVRQLAVDMLSGPQGKRFKPLAQARKPVEPSNE